MAELNIEEARKIYKHDSLKSLMLAKFSKEELEKHEVTQKEFDKTFLELLGKCTKTVFLDGNGNQCSVPTNRIELDNSSGELMFDIQFTGENKHFWVSYARVWKIFEDKYSLNYYEVQCRIKYEMQLRFVFDDVTVVDKNIEPIFHMNLHFGLND